MASAFKRLGDFPMPFWVCSEKNCRSKQVVIFAEGTRFTPEKQAQSEDFSIRKNLHVYKVLFLLHNSRLRMCYTPVQRAGSLLFLSCGTNVSLFILVLLVFGLPLIFSGLRL
jgi:hypothetical protein